MTRSFFDYVVIGSKRYHASRTVGTNHSSLVHVVIPGTTTIHAYSEVLEIFQFIRGSATWMTHSGLPTCASSYPGGESVKEFRMICELNTIFLRLEINILLPSYSADVRLWQLGEYKDQETRLPPLINPDWIVGHPGLGDDRS
jgi:hypothetical protein